MKLLLTYLGLMGALILAGYIAGNCKVPKTYVYDKGNRYISEYYYEQCKTTVIHSKDMFNKARRFNKKKCKKLGYVKTNKYEKRYRISAFFNILFIGIIALRLIISCFRRYIFVK